MAAPLREPSFSVNLGGGHAVPACTEVGDSPDVQVEFLVMEHRLVRVLHQEVGVADDVPLEYLVPWCEIPAHEFQRTMRHLVGEDHPADRLGQIRIGLDAVAVHLSSPFLSGLLLHAPTRCRRHIGGRERGWAWDGLGKDLSRVSPRKRRKRRKIDFGSFTGRFPKIVPKRFRRRWNGGLRKAPRRVLHGTLRGTI